MPSVSSQQEGDEFRVKASSAENRTRRGYLDRFSGGAILSIGTVIILWQMASYFFPPFLFPPVQAIGDKFVSIISTDAIFQATATYGRIIAGMMGAFLIGAMLALPMGRYRKVDRNFTPVLNLLQGIPALSWVVIAIIWFQSTEFRIWFIMVATTLPAFVFQILDSYRSMSRDLLEMTLVFRPSRLQLFRVLVLPTIVPGFLTAWKVNIGNASRVVVVAELVGATNGVGYQLLQSQQLFDMAAAVSWTLTLVVFVVLTQKAIEAFEKWLLSYRTVSERAG